MIQINVSIALEALAKAVEAKGSDHVYQRPRDEYGYAKGCAYLHEDEDGNLTVPGCLVGQVLLDLGVPAAKLERYNTGWDAMGALSKLRYDEVIEVDSDARHVLQAAQATQDNGANWGQALAKAQERAEELANRQADEEYASSSEANPI